MWQKTEPFALPTELQAHAKLTFHILLCFLEKSIPKIKKIERVFVLPGKGISKQTGSFETPLPE